MLKKLSNYFKNLFKTTSTKPKDPENIYSIKIDMYSDLDIEVKLYYDPLLINTGNVISMAERYAELLVYIGSNAFKKKLGEILEEKIKLSTNINEQLLLDNIISFQDLIKKEIQNASAANYTPIIRPISVFNPR